MTLGQDPREDEKLLLNVIEKDETWAIAYEELGDIYYDQKEWAKAAAAYEKAIASSELRQTDRNYFNLAWVYDRLGNLKNTEKYYRKCLEITPDYQFANNNLGYCLKRQRRYEEALEYFRKSIETGKDKFYPYRNTFDTLCMMKKTQEALEFAKEHPEHFKTKYYRNKIQAIKGTQSSKNDKSEIKDIKELNKTTSSAFAETIHVMDGSSGIQLYPHQQDAVRAMDREILPAQKYAGVLVLPTGGGKTLTAAYWVMQNQLDKGRKVLWIAHRHELLNQAAKTFRRICFRDIMRYRDSYNWRIISGQHDKPVNIKPTDDILFASKTSLKRGWQYVQKNWLSQNSNQVFMVIDEAHHAVAREYRELICAVRESTSGFKMLGLTATPFRTANSEQGLLKKVFPNDIVYKIDLRELINRGILSEPIFKSVSTNVNMVELFKENNSDEQLERMAYDRFFDIESIGMEIASAIANNSKRNAAIVGEYVKNKELYGQTIVFALNVDMAIVLSGLFRQAGIRADFVTSNIKDAATHVTISSKENVQKIKKFRNGELDVLVNVNILTEGTDLPKVQTVFLTRPTKSVILMTQMIGRALRGQKAGGTQRAYIVSFLDDWQDKIAWVNPEKLYIDENVDFSNKDSESQKMAVRLVSIAKMEEFAKIANDTVDPRLSDLPFIDRIPIGIYRFSYLIENDEQEENEKNCNILVYDCMKEAYDTFMEWIPLADLSDTQAAADHVDRTLFGTYDILLGYNKQDVVDLIEYYKQTQTIPQMIPLSDRDNYDISKLAQHIVEHDMGPSSQKAYIEEEWKKNGAIWSAFFGADNLKVFRKLIRDAVDQIENPDDYRQPESMPIAEAEMIKIQNLSLYEIRTRYPKLGEKIRNAVFEKYKDEEGFYHSAQSDFKSKNKLFFQIDHIKPMSQGGLTTLDNLQLLTREENMAKSDKI